MIDLLYVVPCLLTWALAARCLNWLGERLHAALPGADSELYT
jgi:hypothetical protein